MAGDFDSKQPIRGTSDELKFDLDLVRGVATAVSTGNANTGTQRVVLATDQPAVSVAGPAAGMDINVLKVGGTATTVNTGNSGAGTLRVVLATDQPIISTGFDKIAGNTVSVNNGNHDTGTQRVVIATDQPDVPVNNTKVSGTAIDVNTGNASAGTQRVVLASDQPAISVNVGAIDDIQTYRGTGVDVAVGGTDTNTYSPAATRYFTGFDASASGQIRVELKIGTTGSETTRGVYFGGGKQGSGIIAIRFPHRITVANTQSVLLVIKNTDNQVQPVYSTIYSNV